MEDIVIEESNVFFEEDLPIIEDIIDEDSELYLNLDQIKSEITDLLYKKYKWIELRRKTSLYFNLFFTDIVESFVGDIDLKPIIEVNKIISYDEFKPSNNYLPDPEYDKTVFVKGESLLDFINKYASLNKNNTNPYITTSKNLYNLQKPFQTISPTNYQVIKNTDAFRHSVFENGACMQYDPSNYSYELLHLIKQITVYLDDSEEILYEGDNVKVVGFYNSVNNNYLKHDIFDLNEYIKNVNHLKLDEKVIIWFNDFFYDNNKKIIKNTYAKVTEVTDKYIEFTLDKKLNSSEVIFYYKNRSTNPFFVYQEDPVGFIFHKSLLLTHNIAIKLSPKNIKFIIPNNSSEFDYINLIKPLKKIAKLPKQPPNVYSIPIYIDTIQLLHNIDNYQFAKTFIDNYLNRFAFLTSNTNYGRSHVLTLLSNYLMKIYNNFKTSKDQLAKELEGIAIEDVKKHIDYTKTICKKYDNIEQLNSDNKKQIYFDKEYDKTLYKLRNEAPSHLKGKTLIAYLRKLLTEEYNFEDVNFEVDAIIKEKRRIRPGDIAILNNKTKYVRRIIEDEEMWIKSISTPFPMCNNKLEVYEDLFKDNTVILDPFDLICKKNIEFKLNLKHQRNINKVKYIENILGFIENYDNIKDEIKKEIRYYTYLPDDYTYIRHLNTNIVNYYEEDVGYADFTGNEYDDLNKIFGDNFEFKENRGILYKFDKKTEDAPNIDIVNTLKNLSNINLDDLHIKYILESVNLRYSLTTVQDAVDKEKLRMDHQKHLLTKKHGELKGEQLKKFDETVFGKIKQVEINTTKQYYKNVILYITGLLNLLLMSLYPDLLMKEVYPRCLQYFSYMGYPLIKNVKKSLTRYFACILISVALPNDIKFGNFYEINIDVVEKEINTTIDDILELKYDLKKQVEDNKHKLESFEDVIKDDSKYQILNTYYRPYFKFIPRKKTEMVTYMKDIYDIIKNHPVLKMNIFNNPMITNACCLELLTKKLNYYDLFNSVNSFKDIHQKMKQIKYKINITKSLIPKHIIHKTYDIFSDFKIAIKSDSFQYKKEKTMDHYEIENMENVYSDVNYNYERIIDQLDDYDHNNIMNIRNMIIDITSYININNVRSSLLCFVNKKLKYILGKIVNQYKFSDKDENIDTELATILKNIYEFDAYEVILQKVKTMMLDIKCDEKLIFADDIKKAILVISNTLMQFLNDYIDLSKERLIIKQSCDIIKYLLNSLAKYLTNNDLNSEIIKTSMEQLREKGKQKMMDAYSKDEEQRQIQMQLKKMGDEGILVITEEVKSTVEPEFIIDQDYKGENDDGDGDNDEDEHFVARDD